MTTTSQSLLGPAKPAVENSYRAIAQHPDWRGAALSDPDNLFSGELAGNRRRAIDVCEGKHVTKVRSRLLFVLP